MVLHCCRATLIYYLSHLREVARHGEHNQMTAGTLSTVVGPAMTGGCSKVTTDPDIASKIRRRNLVIQFIIENVECIQFNLDEEE